MTSSRRHTLWRSLRSRLTAGLALVAYLVAAGGVPLPAFPRKDAGQPFPCQDHPCGCQTAEQCWRHCCCFTPEERWAWAEAHHVTPPPYAEKPTALAWHSARCCNQAGGPAEALPSDSSGCLPAVNGCCHDGPRQASCCHHDRGAQDSRPARPGKWRWATGVDVLRCQGLSTLWVAFGAARPPEPPLAWGPWLSPAGWLSYPDHIPLTLSAPPPAPPPRRQLA